MKRFIGRIYATLLIISFSLVFPDLQAQDRQFYDATSNSMVSMSVSKALQASQKSVSGNRAYTVLWDTTHTPHLQYTPQGKYSNIVSLLADSGFTTVADGQGVNNIDLSLYDVIVICLPSNWSSIYTGAEVNTLLSYYANGHQQVIHTSDANWCDNSYMHLADDSVFSYNVFNWLANQGGILIMSENTACPNENVRPVCQAFSMDCGVSYISPSDLYFSNFAIHPIYNNVSQVYYRAAGELSAVAPAQEIGWTSTSLATVGLMDATVGIELVGFSARLTEQGILLEWATASEFGNVSWVIARRDENSDWKTIKEIPCGGNSSSGSKYEYTDTQMDLRKVEFYRLGNVDYAGKIEWLECIKIDLKFFGPVSGLRISEISPNPFTRKAVIRYTIGEITKMENGNSTTSLSIYDIRGRLVKSFSLKNEDFRREYTVSWNRDNNSGKRVPSGVYFCSILYNGKRSRSRKILLLKRTGH